MLYFSLSFHLIINKEKVWSFLICTYKVGLKVYDTKIYQKKRICDYVFNEKHYSLSHYIYTSLLLMKTLLVDLFLLTLITSAVKSSNLLSELRAFTKFWPLADLRQFLTGVCEKFELTSKISELQFGHFGLSMLSFTHFWAHSEWKICPQKNSITFF